MATLSTVGLHFPEATPDGPWGVGSTPSSWYVVHKVTGRAKRIGCVRGKKINYFDRAFEEADRRNKEYEVMPSDEHCSIPTNYALHLFGLIPEGGMFFDPFSQHEFVKTSATTAVSSTEKDYIEDFHHNEMIVPIEDKGDERPE